MCASLFLCPLKRVLGATRFSEHLLLSPASLSFAPAFPTQLRGIRLSQALPVLLYAVRY